MCTNIMILNTLFYQRKNTFFSLDFLLFPNAQTPLEIKDHEIYSAHNDAIGSLDVVSLDL